MGNIDFSNIDDKEFEELCRDLLSRKLKLNFQSFRGGADQGIDLLYATDKHPHKIVVQVKHYVKSSFSSLLTKLKKEEKKKLVKLKPEQVFICTAQPLSPLQKKKIITGLKPYVKKTEDIYGYEGLTEILARNKDILEYYHKLWLTSTVMLQRVLHNAIQSKSIFYERKVKRDIQLYVKTKTFKKAKNSLRKQRFLLVTGSPGVGKTTLSHLLAYEFLAKGYKLFYSDHQDITEAERALDDDPKKKQLFILDDFLGANYAEIINPRTPHSRVISFVEHIRGSSNKFCILTTRTNVLNKAKDTSENLSRSGIDINKMRVEVKDYDTYGKGRILYNHLKISELNKKYIDYIFKDGNYWSIINHRNYSPRIVEFITSNKIMEDVKTGRQYFERIKYNLDHPQEIWRHAFQNQLDVEDRFLVFTLFSFGKSVNKNLLQRAFNARLAREVENYGHKQQTDSFNNSLKRLLDAFVSSVDDGTNTILSFLNPSINDFLIRYFSKSKEERHRMWLASKFLSQFSNLLYLFQYFAEQRKIDLSDEVYQVIERMIMLNREIEFDDERLEGVDSDVKAFLICKTIAGALDWIDCTPTIDAFLRKKIGEINFKTAIRYDASAVTGFFLKLPKDTESWKFVSKDFENYAGILAWNYSSLESFEELSRLFGTYSESWSNYLKSENDIRSTIIEHMEEDAKELYRSQKNEIFDKWDFQSEVRKIRDFWMDKSRLLELNIDFPLEEYFFDEEDSLDELIAKNKSFQNKERAKERQTRGLVEEKDEKIMRQRVDDLFKRKPKDE